jgi:hypothetical protein
VRLERWFWRGYLFHIPSGDTRKPPESVQILGTISHKHYGRLSSEAALWLYLFSWEWRLFSRALRSSWHHRCGLWPMLNLQRAVAMFSMKFGRRTCWCGKRFQTWGSGWLICKDCRNKPAEPIPF